MRYQVPQFIEIESKIFGPLTLKQFLYLFGSGGIVFILYATLPFFLMVLLGLPIAGFGAALAFYKVNNQPFIKVVENAIAYMIAPRLFLWKKVQIRKEVAAKEEERKMGSQVVIPRFTQSKLKDLAWSLDVKSTVK